MPIKTPPIQHPAEIMPSSKLGLTYPVEPSYAKGKRPLIEMRGVYYDAKEVGGTYRRLDNININIYQGEYLMVFGGSGSGKTFILEMLMGVRKPTGGQVLVANREISKMSFADLAHYRLATLGMIYQEANLIESINAWQNVAMPANISGIGEDKRKQLALRIMESMNLQSIAEKMPNELSAGQRKRIAVARSLMNSPLIMVADEPTADLDTAESEDVMENLRFINEQGNLTLIMATHDPKYVHYPNRVIYVTDNKISHVVENRPLRQY